MIFMSMSINRRANGFAKCAKTGGPKKFENVRGIAGEGGVVPAPDLVPAVTMPEEQPHRPWLVPGAGRL